MSIISNEYIGHGDNTNYTLARVIRMNKKFYTLYSLEGEYVAYVKGKIRYKSHSQSELPVVGDYVLINVIDENNALIEQVVPRKNVLYRKSIGKKTDVQVLASNIDYAFILLGIDNELSVAGIGRYLSMVYASNISPIVAISKIDLYEKDVYEDYLNDIQLSFPNEIIFYYSAKTGENTERFLEYIVDNTSSVFIGSSGSGKSTIINYLLKEEKMKTGDVRERDYKGMHTTTHRELFELQNGGVVIDTPGLRQLGVWEDANGIKKTFSDLEDMAKNCKFNDCTHEHEPDCYILKMIEDDKLSVERYNVYIMLRNESEELSKQNVLNIGKTRKAALKKVTKIKKK